MLFTSEIRSIFYGDWQWRPCLPEESTETGHPGHGLGGDAMTKVSMAEAGDSVTEETRSTWTWRKSWIADWRTRRLEGEGSVWTRKSHFLISWRGESSCSWLGGCRCSRTKPRCCFFRYCFPSLASCYPTGNSSLAVHAMRSS